MKLNILIISIFIFLLDFNSIGQSKKYIRLFDSYSNQRITIDSTIIIKNKKFKIDKEKNLIAINFSISRNVTIELENYDTYSDKLKFNKNDTISIRLTPNETTINKRFNELWNIENKTTDTLTFETTKRLEEFTRTYLNYLSVLKNNCDNGMCNYSNTYSYKIFFVNIDSVYQIDKVESTKNNEYHCIELSNKMTILKDIFPKFRLQENTGNFYFQYNIILR